MKNYSKQTNCSFSKTKWEAKGLLEDCLIFPSIKYLRLLTGKKKRAHKKRDKLQDTWKWKAQLLKSESNFSLIAPDVFIGQPLWQMKNNYRSYLMAIKTEICICWAFQANYGFTQVIFLHPHSQPSTSRKPGLGSRGPNPWEARGQRVHWFRSSLEAWKPSLAAPPGAPFPTSHPPPLLMQTPSFCALPQDSSNMFYDLGPMSHYALKLSLLSETLKLFFFLYYLYTFLAKRCHSGRWHLCDSPNPSKHRQTLSHICNSTFILTKLS